MYETSKGKSTVKFMRGYVPMRRVIDSCGIILSAAEILHLESRDQQWHGKVKVDVHED
jgi:hypothetical protein